MDCLGFGVLIFTNIPYRSGLLGGLGLYRYRGRYRVFCCPSTDRKHGNHQQSCHFPTISQHGSYYRSYVPNQDPNAKSTQKFQDLHRII